MATIRGFISTAMWLKESGPTCEVKCHKHEYKFWVDGTWNSVLMDLHTDKGQTEGEE